MTPAEQSLLRLTPEMSAMWEQRAAPQINEGVGARTLRAKILLSRWEPVAEGAARCALHDGLLAREADLAAARCRNIEIGLADQ
jgi:hypothetical protein